MNWEHFKAFVWLRWRLLYNQNRRAGVLNAVLTMIVFVAALLTAIPLFIGCLVLGLYAIPKAQPKHLMYVGGRRGGRLSVLLDDRADHRAATDRPAVAFEVHAFAGFAPTARS